MVFTKAADMCRSHLITSLSTREHCCYTATHYTHHCSADRCRARRESVSVDLLMVRPSFPLVVHIFNDNKLRPSFLLFYQLNKAKGNVTAVEAPLYPVYMYEREHITVNQISLGFGLLVRKKLALWKHHTLSCGKLWWKLLTIFWHETELIIN